MALRKGWVDVATRALVKAEWNYKEEDSDKSQKLSANIERNGQLETIIIRDKGRGKYEVVNGNHRLDAFKSCDIKEVHAYNLGVVSDATAQRIAIETNETRFATNDLRLAELLQSIQVEFEVPDILSTMPFTEDQLDSYTKLLSFSFEELPQPPAGHGESIPQLTIPMDAALQALWLDACSKAGENGAVKPEEVFAVVLNAYLGNEEE